MAKRLFLLLICSFIGVINAPEILTATDTISLNGLSSEGVVETVVLPEPEVEPAKVDTGSVAVGPVRAVQAVAVNAPAAGLVYVAPANNIQINGRTIELGYTETTIEDAEGAAKAWFYKSGKFIYGHNSGNTFGFLNAAYDSGRLAGMTFTVNMNGASSVYTVANYRLYDYNAGAPNSLSYGEANTTMKPIVNARLDGQEYRMAIMTCYAGGAKRLVVFAN